MTQTIKTLRSNREQMIGPSSFTIDQSCIHSEHYITLWIVQGLIYIACMLFYFKVAPYELIFDLWIPLDFFIFLSMTAYAIICHQENKRREEALKNTNRKNTKHSSNFFASNAGLTNQMDFVCLSTILIFVFWI